MSNFTEYEENMLQIASAQYIQMCRIYDFLSVIADKLGIDAVAIKDMHEKGETFSPAPYLNDGGEDESL